MSWKEETTTGQGGQKTGTGIYAGKFQKNGKQFVAKTNVKTGAVDIYETNQGLFGLGGDKLVSQFSPTDNKWTPTDYGKELRNSDFGAGNFAKLQDETRVSAYDNVLKDNASQDVLDKPGFKSRSGLANIPPEEGTGNVLPTGSADNNNTIYIANIGGSKKSPFPQGTQGHYPIDIKETDQDRIKFQAVQLSKRTVTNPTEYKSVAGPVFISMQGPIIDQNLVDWGDSKVYGGGQLAASGALNLMEGGNDNKFLAEVQNKAKELGININELTASLAAGNLDIFTRLTQQVFNPNLELIFKQPQLRPFNFQFKMSARGADEAEEIKKIIRYFKYHMAPKGKGGDLFLKGPDVFWIEYQKGDEKLHQSLNLIAPEDAKKKACALMNMSVNYTPLGTYMTYDDEEATIVQYDISLSFKEITPVYQVDYEEEPGENHSIGY